MTKMPCCTGPVSRRESACRGFTLLELMIAVAILAVFLFFSYKIFIGGSKTAGRAQWTNSAVDELRIATGFLSKELKSTSYPTTLLQDGISDPSDNADAAVARKYFVKILANHQEIAAPAAGAKKKVMTWVSCQPEKPPAAGVMKEFTLWFEGRENTLTSVGDLYVEIVSRKFTTAAPQYAKTGQLNLVDDGQPGRQTLVRDAAWIKFEAPGPLPSGATEFQPLKISIRCVYPKDPKAFKDNSTMATPNVGLETLP